MNNIAIFGYMHSRTLPQNTDESAPTFLRSLFDSIGSLFSFSKPEQGPEQDKGPPNTSSELKIKEFTLIQEESKTKPLAGLLGKLQKMIPTGFAKTVYETALSLPFTGKADLNLADTTQASAQLILKDKVTCNIHLSLAPAAAKTPQDLTSPARKLHPLLTALLDASTINELKSLGQLSDLINDLPLQQTSIEWKAAERKAVISMTLPENASLKLDLTFPQGIGALEDDIPTFIKKIIPLEAYEMLPGISPLEDQNFRFEWNGETSKFALEFESSQVLNLTELELKGNLFIKFIGFFLGKTLKINLPNRIAGTIDPNTMTITFEENSIFKVKIKKLERLGKTVTLKSVQYDAANEMLSLGFKLFWMHHTVVIDLKTSIIDKKAFKFVSKTDKQAYSPSILQPVNHTGTTGPNTYLEGIKSTLRSMIPVHYHSLFDIFAKTRLGGNLSFDLQEKSISTEFKLSDEISCRTSLKFKDENPAQKGVELNQELLKQIQEKLKGKVDSVDEIISLLTTLPTQTTSVNWEGKSGKATVHMQLPGGVLLTVELTAPKLIGQSVKDIPPRMKEILSNLVCKELFTSVRPFLSSNFGLTWNGQSSEFSLIFKEAQQVHIKEIKLPQGGIFASLAKFVGNNSFLRLPTEVKGKINFKDLSVEFKPKLTFDLKSGIVSKEFDLKKIQYDAKEPQVKIDFNFFGSHSEKISLNSPKPSEKKPEVKVDFTVGPVKN